MKNFVLNKAIVVFMLLISLSLSAQIPNGYYDQADNKSGAVLKSALAHIIKDHTKYSYSNLWTSFYTTDDKPNGTVWDMYSDIPDGSANGNPPYVFEFGTNQCATTPGIEGICYNREHSFPKSWFGGVESDTMYTDMFHLIPTDSKVNSMRSNNPYGEVDSPTWSSQNGSKLGPCVTPGFTGTAFEPLDEYKGDLARSYFYMATRYESRIASWQSYTGADDVLNGTSFPCYDQWFIDLLLDWNALDPVSQKEIDRNNEIYTTYQHNRNPYIDHPEYAVAVWLSGEIKAEPSNHATDLASMAGIPGSSAITLTWTDATGTVLPDGYLIKGSMVSLDDITNPIDGFPVSNDGLNKNIYSGTETYTFTNLSASTAYYFKVYSYTNSVADIDYKTDPVITTTTLTTTEGTSVLQPGEIAFIGYGTDDPDKFAFVLLTDVAENTEITFTDNGWLGSVLRTGENTGIWTAPVGGLSKGTVISIQGTTVTGGGTMSNALSGLSTSGDQILAYQGTSASPDFIAGISSTGWVNTGSINANSSYLPIELSLFSSALGFSSEMDNGYYTGPISLTISTAHSIINHPDNWLRSNTIQTFPLSWPFVIGTQTVINVNTSVETLTVGTGETLTVQDNSQLTITPTPTSK